jgi:signal transduction histidine kinase
MGDASQIQQVFINLLTNARDAMPGGGRLSISSEAIELESKRVWQLKVSDTGVGIPEEDLSQIFDPFFTTKPPDKGTGLGLSILHGIVETHGGDVSAESEVGAGTTFIIRLPEADKKTTA